MDEKTMVNDILNGVKSELTTYQTVISETEKRTRKFSIGGRAKAKVGSGFRINNKKYNVGDTVNYKGQQYLVTDRNEAIPLPNTNSNIIDDDINIPTTMRNALVWFIASRIWGSRKDDQASNKSVMYMQQYLSACELLRNTGTGIAVDVIDFNYKRDGWR